MRPATVDLCAEAPSRVQSAAFYALKELEPGGALVLLTAQEPELIPDFRQYVPSWER